MFSSPPSGGSNQCKLDSGSFGACTTPTTRTYSGLAAGSHTFQVRAVDSSGKTSSPASRTWVIDATNPSVASITRVGTSPTNAPNVSWTVTFSEAVSGVDTGDFALAKVGLATATLTGVTGSGAAYTVSSSTGSGDGTLGLNLVDNDSIVDAAGNKLGGTGVGNGNFTGQVFTLDRSGPSSAPTITSGPSGLVASTSASFAFSSGESGVAGFQCSLDGGTFAACASPKSYSGLGQGARSFQVRAVDALGNPGPAATRSWTVDTVPPPAPVLTDKPDDPNGSAISTFTWTDAEAGVTFECSIENGPYGPCSSPFTFEVIVDTSNNGQHQFAVRAIDTAGNRSSTTTYRWKVDNSIGFTITGNASDLLYPGIWRPLVLTLHNPHNFTIYVTLLQTTVADAPGCAAGSNVEVQQSDIDSTVAKRVAVPSNGTAPVPAARRPQIRLKNLPSTNQDSCKSKRFTLSYSGTATK